MPAFSSKALCKNELMTQLTISVGSSGFLPLSVPLLKSISNNSVHRERQELYERAALRNGHLPKQLSLFLTETVEHEIKLCHQQGVKHFAPGWLQSKVVGLFLDGWQASIPRKHRAT